MKPTDPGERAGAAVPRLGWVVPALALAAVVWFWPAFGFGFRSDDYALVQLVDRTTGSVRWDQVWSHVEGPWFQAPYYRPGASLSLALDLRPAFAPWWPHVTNVLLVLVVALAAAWLTLRSTPGGSRAAALVAGLVVLAHPASVEPALWISGRVSSLCVACMLGACIVLCTWRRRVAASLVAALCAAAAVSCYEGGVMTPVWCAAALALGAGPSAGDAGAAGAGSRDRRWLLVVPAVFVVLGYLIVRWAALGAVVDARADADLGTCFANLAARVTHLVLPPPATAWPSLLAAGGVAVLLFGAGRASPRALLVLGVAAVLAMAPTSLLPQSAGVLFGRWVFLAVPALAIACGRAVAAAGRYRHGAFVAVASMSIGMGITARGEIRQFQGEDAHVQRAAEVVRELAGAAQGQPFGIAGLPGLPGLHVGMHGLLGLQPFVDRDLSLVGLSDLFDRDAPVPLLLGDGAPVHALAAAGGAAYFDMGNGQPTPMQAPAAAEVVLRPDAQAPGVFAAPAGTPPRALACLTVASAVPVHTVVVRFVDDAPLPLAATATRRLAAPATVVEVDLTHALLPLVAAVFQSFRGRVYVELDGVPAPPTTVLRALAALPVRALAGALAGGVATPAQWAAAVARQAGNEPAQLYVMTPLGIRTVVVPAATDAVADQSVLDHLQRSVRMLGAHTVHWFWQSPPTADGAPWRTPFDRCVLR